MKLVAGLGNPGRRYRKARHNVGFRVAERLAERHRIRLEERRFQGRVGRGLVGDRAVAILEPETFMNASGAAVAEAVRGLGVEDVQRDLIVAYDDVDLPFGRLRLRARGSSGGHRGLRDVLAQLGREDVPRLRFGIGRPERPMDTVDWVLDPFSDAEERALPDHLDRAAEALELFLERGVAAAMDRYNAAANPESGT